MPNICENKFYISCDNEEIMEKIENKLEEVFTEQLEGEITYVDPTFIEGWFNSGWVFPKEVFNNFFDEFEDDTIYMRNLSEEYGMLYIALNIYHKGYWEEEQTFNL